MGMSKANGTLKKPTATRPDGTSCFVVPPSEQPEIDSSAVVNPSPSEVLAQQPYVQASDDADNTVSAAQGDAMALAYLQYMTGMSVTVTFYHQINNDSTARSFFNDYSKHQDNVHTSYLKINNFQMKVKESFSFSYDASKVKSQLTGEAILYPFFVPWAGDLFIYQVQPGTWGLYKISEAPQRLTIKDITGHEIKFILVDYLNAEDLQRLNDCVAEEKYFNLKRYISGEGSLLTSDETETLSRTNAAISKLSKYYVSEFFDKYIYRSFIENPCLYDPYIVEFITQVFDYKYFKSYPTQLVPSPDWWSRSFWARLLDPESVPEEILVGKCFRVLKGVHYRTAGINALTNRCYIRLHPAGRHNYPPFNIPEEYDADKLTVQQQILLYLQDGKVRPTVLFNLSTNILTCSRLARFYFIPILVFLLKKLQGALETGTGVDIVTDPKAKECDLNCDSCVYACSCAHHPLPPPPPTSTCKCCKHNDQCNEYTIPDDGGNMYDHYEGCCTDSDCGEQYEGLTPEETELVNQIGDDPTIPTT